MASAFYTRSLRVFLRHFTRILLTRCARFLLDPPPRFFTAFLTRFLNAFSLPRLLQRAIYLQTHKDTPAAEEALCATEIHRKKPRRSPRVNGAENANDGKKAPARHQDGADQHPRCTSRPKHPGDRTGRTRDIEFSEGIGKCRGGRPDRLFAASLATSTTPRARPESWALGRASTVPPPASLTTARRHPLVALSSRAERLAPPPRSRWSGKRPWTDDEVLL